jgi:hypothetical protein
MFRKERLPRRKRPVNDLRQARVVLPFAIEQLRTLHDRKRKVEKL